MIKDILKDSSKIYIYQGFALIFGMITSVIVARHFGPEGKGQIDLFLLIGTMFVEFTILGIGSSMIRFRAKLNYELSELHGIAIYYSFFILFLSFITIAILNYLSFEYIYLLSIILAPLLLYKQIVSSILISLNRAITIYKFNFFIALSLMAIVSTFYLTNFLSIKSYLIIFILITTISLYLLYKLIKSFHLSKKVYFNNQTFKELVSFGFIIYLGALVNIMHFKVDQLMISSMLSVSQLGIYTISVRWAEMLFFIDMAIVSTISYKVTSGDKESTYRLAYTSSLIIAFLGIVFFLFFLFFSEDLILFLYGDEYSGAIQPLIYLLPGVIFWSLSKPLSIYITLNLGKTKLITTIAFIGLIINILFNYLLINLYGISGAAISSSISYAIVGLLIIGYFTKQNKGLVI